MSDLREALADLISLCERKLYPQPDKPNSDWMRVQAAKAALAQPQNEAEMVAWRVKNDFGHWYTTMDRALAETWRDTEKYDVQPLYTAPPSPERMREALIEGAEILTNLIDSIHNHGNYSPESTITFLDNARQCVNEALRAGDNHASEGKESGIDTFAEMNQKLRDRLASDGKESEGGPLNWKLSDDAKARIAEIDNNRRNAAINASNIVAGNLPSDDLGAPLERIRTEAARLGYALVPNDREAIARIIAPDTFAKFDAELAKGRRAENGRCWAELSYGEPLNAAREKADRILALRGGE